MLPPSSSPAQTQTWLSWEGDKQGKDPASGPHSLCWRRGTKEGGGQSQAMHTGDPAEAIRIQANIPQRKRLQDFKIASPVILTEGVIFQIQSPCDSRRIALKT